MVRLLGQSPADAYRQLFQLACILFVVPDFARCANGVHGVLTLSAQSIRAGGYGKWLVVISMHRRLIQIILTEDALSQSSFGTERWKGKR